MAQRYGGRFSPGAGPQAAADNAPLAAPAALARAETVKMALLPPLPFLIPAFRGTRAKW